MRKHHQDKDRSYRITLHPHVLDRLRTEDEQVPGALKILKECAGARQSVKYTMPSMSTGSLGPGANSMIPIDMQVGGCTVFVVDVDQYEKF